MSRVSWGRIVGVAALFAAPVVVATVAATPAGATNVTPSTTADGGAGSGSLRDVLENVVVNGDTVVLQPGATYTLTLCGSPDMFINNSITIDGGSGATIAGTCPNRRDLVANNDLVVKGVTFTGGDAANDGGAIDLQDGSKWSIINSTFSGNKAVGDDAGAVDVNTLGDLTITHSTFVNNHAKDDGGAIDCENDGSTMTISGSTFAGNATVTGSGHSGGAIDLESDCSLSVRNSTFANNNSADGAAITQEQTGAAGTVTIAYSTIVNNALGGVSTLGVAAPPSGGTSKPDKADSVQRAAPGGVHAQANGAANLAIATPANLTVFGSVFGLPQGGVNCSNTNGSPLTGVVSQGFNFVDDSTCGLTAATDHQVASGAFLLGPLASNGGPTQTLLPQTGSPLIDAIPVSACQTGAAAGVTVDQRGLARPAMNGCDAGAVEVQAAVITVVPRFTG